MVTLSIPSDPAWEPAAVAPLLAMEPIHGSDPRLHLAEASRQGVRSVAVHWLGPLRKELANPLNLLRELPIEEEILAKRRIQEHQQWSSAVIQLEDTQEAWLGVAVVNMPSGYVAVCEVRIHGSRQELWSALTSLVARVLPAGNEFRLPWVLKKGARIGGWIASVTMLLGILTLGMGSATWTRYVSLSGLVFLLLVSAVTLGATFVRLRRAGHPSVTEQVLELGDNPGILAPGAGSIGVATAIGAVLFWSNTLGGWFAAVYWLTLILGVAVVFFGSPHRLLRQVWGAVVRWREPKPTVQLGEWREVPPSQVPDDIARPPGRLIAAYQHSQRGTWATIAAATAGQDPAWTRWNQMVTEWDSPRGKVSARMYQTWDRQVESIVEMSTAEQVIVLETPRDLVAAEGFARALTTKLPTVEKGERRRSTLTGFLTYSHVPVTALWLSGGIIWLAGMSGLGNNLVGQGAFRFVAIMLALVPPYLLAASTAAIVRPEWFRFGGEPLRRRAYRVLWSAVGASAVSGILAAVWVSRFWDNWAQALLGWGVLLGLLVVMPVVNGRIGRVRQYRPPKVKRGTMRR